MAVKRNLGILALAAAVMVAGCDRSQGIGRLLGPEKTQSGPDEFAILPTKPLEYPEDLTTLPEPSTAGGNRAAKTPSQDAVAALGGNPSALSSTVISSADRALLARATRYGIAPGIRRTLAAQDVELRSKNRGKPLERMFNTNIYFRAYTPYLLNAYLELERLRRAGVATPAVPPHSDDE